jgi:transposase
MALNRKNALFAGHDEGGVAWGRLASLIGTCKINGIEPFAYLKATLAVIANWPPAGRPRRTVAMELQAVKLS